jgi:hypothetical protein
MHIECEHKLPVSLFFFAHQDDEFGVYHRISLARAMGHRVFCAYLTSGVSEGQSPSVRDKESIRVLANFGITRDQIIFTGAHLSIPDGQLLMHLDRAIEWIEQWVDSFDVIAAIFVPAWEGGHPDHDALHAAVLIATLGIESQLPIKQFPLYNGYKCSGPLFRVFKPLPENGIIESSRIPWRSRCRFLRYCLSYLSQSKSWLGLFPFTLIHYLFLGIESVQGVCLQRLSERPHIGQLYYERRQFCTWTEVLYAVGACLKQKTLNCK